MTTMLETNHKDKTLIEWQRLAITIRDNRIAELESAIREFLKSTDDVFFDNFPNILKAEENLRNLMENKS